MVCSEVNTNRDGIRVVSWLASYETVSHLSEALMRDQFHCCRRRPTWALHHLRDVGNSHRRSLKCQAWSLVMCVWPDGRDGMLLERGSTTDRSKYQHGCQRAGVKDRIGSQGLGGLVSDRVGRCDESISSSSVLVFSRYTTLMGLLVWCNARLDAVCTASGRGWSRRGFERETAD